MKIFKNRYNTWHKKFAFFPTYLTDTLEWIWLEWYERRLRAIDGVTCYERTRRFELDKGWKDAGN